MAQQIDLNGPAAAEALRIADALVRELLEKLPLPDPSNTDQVLVWMNLRGKNIAYLAETILRYLSVASEESDLHMKGSQP